MTDAPLTSWERSHHNGCVAQVLELLWTKKNDAYSYGAMQAGTFTQMGRRVWATRKISPTWSLGVRSHAAARLGFLADERRGDAHRSTDRKRRAARK